jgi:hypothetical protein
MIGVWLIVGFLIGLASAALANHASATKSQTTVAHSEWTALGTGGVGSAEGIDADWTRRVFRQMASGRFF